MKQMTFREAQLMCLGINPSWEFVALNNLQVFNIGDHVKVVEIRLDSPSIVVNILGHESYCDIKNFSDAVINECIGIMREVVMEIDKKNKGGIVKREYIYKENKIIEYSPSDFMATFIKDDDIITKCCKSLDEAKEWIDKHLVEE